MFDLKYFNEKPEAFYSLAQEFLDLDKFQPTLTHYFIKLLQDKGILQFNLTQNIDNLEEKAGLDMEEKVVQAHGANRGAMCGKCKQQQNEKELAAAIKQGTVLKCKLDYISKEINEIEDQKDGETVNHQVNHDVCGGFIKPNITFFGEALPKRFFEAWEVIKNVPKNKPDLDLEKEENPEPKFPHGGCDLMIVIGTGLAVTPFANTVSQAENGCPKVLMNLENTAVNGFDF